MLLDIVDVHEAINHHLAGLHDFPIRTIKDFLTWNQEHPVCPLDIGVADTQRIWHFLVVQSQKLRDTLNLPLSLEASKIKPTTRQ